MKKVIASAGLLALGAMGSETAMAQWTAASDKPWSVTGTLRGFYDDNINTSPTKVSSVGYEIRPSITYNKNLGPTAISASYAYSYRYYEERLNNKADQSHDFDILVSHDFSERYSLAFEDRFVIAQEPEYFATSGVTTFPFRSNGDNVANFAALRFHAELTKLIGLNLSYANTYVNYEEDAGNTLTPSQPSRSAVLDRWEHLVRIESTWVLSELTTGLLGYEFGATDYTSGEPINSPVGIGPFVSSDTRNKHSHTFYVGAQHAFLPELTGSARVGFTYNDYYGTDKLPPIYQAGTPTSDTSPYVELNLSYRYGDGGTISAGYSHRHNATDQAASALNPGAGVTQDQESDVLFGSLSQKLTPLSPRLTGSITGQFQHSVYNGGPNDGQADNFFVLGLNLAYQFSRYLSAEVGYNYDTLNSDVVARGYNRNRVYAGVSATY